jgi:hypothetical protein
VEKPEVVAFINRIVSEASPSPMRGARLSGFIKAEFKDFNTAAFECRNLRQFIRKYVPEIIEDGKAGTDILYKRKEEQRPLFDDPIKVVSTVTDRPAPLRQLLDNPRIWKTFASPDSYYKLYYFPESEQLRVNHPGDPPEPNACEIAPISAQALKDMAVSFIDTLPDPERGPLLKTLDMPKWWFPYFDALTNRGLKSRWIAYRRRRIAEAFEKALLSVSLTAPQHSSSKPEHAKDATKAGVAQGVTMREIAAKVVQRLTEPELRSLNLPLGYVMDAMNR